MALQAERTGPGGRPAVRAAPPWGSSGRPGKVTAAPQPGPTARGLCCSSASLQLLLNQARNDNVGAGALIGGGTPGGDFWGPHSVALAWQ